MKINFNGSYREVERLLKPQQNNVTSSVQFETLLSSIAPDKPQAADINDKNTIASQLSTTGSDELHARMKLPSPSLELPSLELEPTAPSHVETPTPPLESVKSPTLRSVRKIVGEDPFSGMSAEAKQQAVRNIVQAAGTKHGIDPVLSMAVVSTESSFNPTAVSDDGHFSKGLMQLLDETGKEQLSRSTAQSSYAPFDPKMNIDLGVQYLRELHNSFSAATTLQNGLITTPAANSSSLEKLAVAAYNAGQGRVASAQERAVKAGKNAGDYTQVAPYLPQSTQDYVQKVVSQKERFAAQFIG